MTNQQFYVLAAIPLVGILMNSALFIYLGGRLDKLVDKVNDMDKRIAVLEEHRL